jgi:hypothetical protein
MLLVATDDGTDPAYAVCRRAGLDLARREGATVVLYDRSSESYLVDPYESGPWTSQNYGPAGDRPWTSLSWSAWAAGTWSSRSPGPGIGAAGRGLAGPGHRCSRHGRRLPAPRVDRVVLPAKLARPSLRDRVLGRTLAAFQARLSAKITLVDEHGAVVDA